MSEIINDDIQLDSTGEKTYREKTTLEQHKKIVEETFESGTIKITEDLYKTASYALESRIKDTATYTEQRIARINKNYELYYGQVLPIVRDLCDDWIDKLYKIFADFGDALKIKADGLTIDQFITKSLEVSGIEDKAPQGRLRSLLKFILKDKFVQKEIFYFGKKEVIKEFLKNRIKKAKIKTLLEDFITKGVITGQFCFKEGWGETKDYKLVVNEANEGSEDGKEYVSQGNLKYTTECESIYNLTVPDTRQLIFRKDSLEWVIEHIKTNYWKLIEDSVDAKGKPKKNAVYDMAMLDRVKKMMKANPKAYPEDADGRIKLSFDNDIDMDNIYELEGNVEVLEGHDIPLVIDKVPTKCIIVALNFEGKLIPIRIQATSFILGNPYKMVNFLEKNDDVAGMGLPEKLEKLTTEINEMNDDMSNLVKMAIKGITAGDKTYFKNPEQLKNLASGDHIAMKNTKGLKISEVLEWFRPPIDTLPTSFDMLKFYMDFTNKISRKGPGDKITPNPTATEATVIMDVEAQPVNRVGVRLNNYFGEVLSNMYFYTLMNRESRFALKINASRIKSDVKFDEVENINKIEGDVGVEKFEKDIELARDELLIEGVQFEIEAVQMDEDKQAVQKQQYMQAINLLMTMGMTKQEIDPVTQQPVEVPKTYQDEMGNEVTLDWFKIITDFLDRSNITDPWKAVEPVTSPDPNIVPSNGAGGSNTPPLNASPANKDILSGAVQT